ncbi:MAG TPA: sigma-70 family RNA polymerase sigma factor, partial [Chitinophagales bacterium]|nr:sigma-70 family RNA polymerase sigma factor [Chitinophagales bacterium]
IKNNVLRTTKLSDQELVSQYIGGNQLALERLILRHKNKVFTSIYLMVKDEFLAEDIFQETFIKAIDTIRAGKYNDEGKFAQWVSRIGYNLCMDHFRKVKRLPTIVTSDGNDLFSHLEFEETPVEDFENLELLEAKVKDLVEKLPEEQKEVVILRHFFDFSFKEVSERTGAPLNTCLGRMRYALINLRRLMEENKVALKPL